MYELILCEGNTDQILIGSYIESISAWRYLKDYKNNPFPKERINWYSNSTDRYIGIWDNGGDNFDSCLNKICFRERNDHCIERILIITDNDDESAQKARPCSIYEAFANNLQLNTRKKSLKVNGWIDISYLSVFGIANCRIGYLLVPIDKAGALETYMIYSLSENKVEQKETLDQVDVFVENFKSNAYLKARRDRVKAKLGIALSVFNPDKSFCIMKEIIDSVDWAGFNNSISQFEMVRELTL